MTVLKLNGVQKNEGDRRLKTSWMEVLIEQVLGIVAELCFWR